MKCKKTLKKVEEQKSQLEAGTHAWRYAWNEDNQSWDLTDDLA